MLIPKSQLRVAVTVEPSLGNTGDGDTYGPPFVELGSLNRTRRLHRSPTSDTLIAEAVLVVAPGSQIKTNDRVSEGGDQWIVEKVAPAYVGSTVFQVEVWMK